MAPRNFLTVKQKVHIISFNKVHKLSVRSLAKKFKVGKTQIADILKNEDQLVKCYRTNDVADKTIRMFRGVGGGAIIDKAVIEWYRRIRTQKIAISGPMIQMKALEIAKELGDTAFKASHGWLERFRTRHDIKFKSICVESASVNESTVEEWKSKITGIIDGYAPKDIFNVDETGLFYCALPDKTLCFKGDSCAGGKMAKERLTVLLCCSMTGEKLKPLIIGKAKKPRCFKGVDIETLGVYWKFNIKSWMTTNIMTEWLMQLNNKMRAQNRKILLFLDNATSHPHLNLENVKLVFLPPNSSSTLQPLDQGIIQNFKIKYRQLILHQLIINLDQNQAAQELAKNISVLTSIMWIKSAWNAVTVSTIKNCFKNAGFPDVENCFTNCEKLLDKHIEDLSELIHLSNMNMDAREFLENDANVSTESTSLDIKEILNSVQDVSDKIEEEVEDDIDEIAKLDTTIKNYDEGLKFVKQLRDFYTKKQNMEAVNLIYELLALHEKAIVDSKTKKQTKITSFFKVN